MTREKKGVCLRVPCPAACSPAKDTQKYHFLKKDEVEKMMKRVKEIKTQIMFPFFFSSGTEEKKRRANAVPARKKATTTGSATRIALCGLMYFRRNSARR